MGARIDDSDLLARIADHIVATKGATLADALKALNVPHPSHRRIYTKWDRRGLGLVTEAAWRAGEQHQAAAEPKCGAGIGGEPIGAWYDQNFPLVPRATGACPAPDDFIPVPPPLARPSLLSRVKRFWE